MKPTFLRVLVVAAGLAVAMSAGMALLQRAQADSKPPVQLNVGRAAPREVNETVQQAVARDYAAAWQALGTAMTTNDAAALNDNFIGFALDGLTQRIKAQRQNGLRARIIDHGHNVAAVFYSPEGSAIELKDTAEIETQIIDGDTVLHSDRAQIQYYVVMTGAEDRWKVRVLQSSDTNE